MQHHPAGNGNGNGRKWLSPSTFNFGHLVLVVTLLFGFGANWAVTSGQVTQNSIAIQKGAERDELFRAKLFEIQLEGHVGQEKLRLEVAAGREVSTSRLVQLEEKLTALRAADVARLVAQMDRRP